MKEDRALNAADWLKQEGYPEFMNMTRDNLENILNRYAAQLNKQVGAVDVDAIFKQAKKDALKDVAENNVGYDVYLHWYDIHLKAQFEKILETQSTPTISNDYWKGFDYALALLDEMYAKSYSHPFNVADCIKSKVNRLDKKLIRKNTGTPTISFSEDEIFAKLEKEAERLYLYKEATIFNSGEIGIRQRNAVDRDRMKFKSAAIFGAKAIQAALQQKSVDKK